MDEPRVAWWVVWMVAQREPLTVALTAESMAAQSVMKKAAEKVALMVDR